MGASENQESQKPPLIFWRTKWHLLATIVLILAIDHGLSLLADWRIRARDADFLERVANFEADWSPEAYRVQGCEFRYQFLIYGYETCFLVRNPANPSFTYTYKRPRPKFAIFFRGDSPKNYYFRDITGRHYWKSVTTSTNEIHDYTDQHSWRN